MMSLYAHVADNLGPTLDKIAADQQKALRDKAIRMGWPMSAANTILVEHGNGALHASAGPGAMLYEYGDAGQPAKSVVRMFNATQHQEVSEAVDRALFASIMAPK